MQQIIQYQLKSWGKACEIHVRLTCYQEQNKKDFLRLGKHSFWPSDYSLFMTLL